MFLPTKDDGSFLDSSVLIGLSRQNQDKYLFTLDRNYSNFYPELNKWIIPLNTYFIENNSLQLLINRYNCIYQNKWFAVKAKDLCKTIKDIEKDLNCTIYIWHKVRYSSDINSFFQEEILPEIASLQKNK